MTLPHASPVDAVLIARIRAGDERAYEQLFRRYYRLLCRYAGRIDRSSGAAEEIVQEVFFRVWSRRDQLQQVQSLSSYLYAAVRNQAFNRLGRIATADRWRRTKAVEPEEPASAPSAEQEVEASELAGVIDRAIEQLPPRCRQAFLLHRREHRTCAEIAQIMRIAPKTVETQIGTALKLLRKALADWM